MTARERAGHSSSMAHLGFLGGAGPAGHRFEMQLGLLHWGPVRCGERAVADHLKNNKVAMFGWHRELGTAGNFPRRSLAVNITVQAHDRMRAMINVRVSELDDFVVVVVSKSGKW